MCDIVYRVAVMEDCHELAKLKCEVWNTTYRGIYPDEKIDNYDVERNKQTFERLIENPNTSLYVAANQIQRKRNRLLYRGGREYHSRR